MAHFEVRLRARPQAGWTRDVHARDDAHAIERAKRWAAKNGDIDLCEVVGHKRTNARRISRDGSIATVPPEDVERLLGPAFSAPAEPRGSAFEAPLSNASGTVARGRR
ncbi:MAG TPA: hypothetical protein VIY73_15755 [Polyangiaceae bacterium]